jgi:drug/metabolite transporter (DMT)-like permease
VAQLIRMRYAAAQKNCGISANGAIKVNKDSIKAYIAWGNVCLFWGSTYLAIRIGVVVFPPALFAGFRFAIAGLVFLAFLKFRGHVIPGWKDILDNAIVGIMLLVLANGVVVWAEQWVQSSLAALTVATVPFWMVGFEAALPGGDKLNFRKIVGIILGFIGLVQLLGPDLKDSFDPGSFKGILALSLAACSWAAGSIFSKHRNIKTDPMMAAAIQMISAGILLSLVGGFLGEFSRLAFSWRGLGALAYLIVFGSLVGYSSYIYALSKLPVSKLSMYAYINPVIAVVLGWLVLGERFDGVMVTSTVMVLMGVVLVKTAPKEVQKPFTSTKPSMIAMGNFLRHRKRKVHP